MRQRHPEREELEQFANDRLPAALGRWIEDHLRTGCAVCQKVIDELLPRMEPSSLVSHEHHEMAPTAEHDAQWDGVFARLEERLVQFAEQRDSAPPLVDELVGLDRARRKVASRSARFHNMAVCEELMERGFEEGFLSPSRALELAELALEISLRLDEATCGRA